jgi:hypothetical protein
LAFEFFRNEGFFEEPFIFLDLSASVMGSLGGVTLPCSCFFSSPSSSSLSTFSPPSSGESGVVSFDVLLHSCTSSFFFFLLFLGASYYSQVTIGSLIRSGSESSICLIGTGNSAGHPLVISSMSSFVSL